MSTSVDRCEQARRVLQHAPELVSTAALIRARTHAASCERCTAALATAPAGDAVGRLRSAWRDAEQASGSEAAARVLTSLEPVLRGPGRLGRSALATCSVIQLVLAAPWLFGWNPWPLLGSADAAHVTRDGALGLCLGATGLVTAWRHRYAVATAVIAVSALAAQIALALVDGGHARVSPAFEGLHLLGLAIVGLIFVAARRSSPRRVTSRRGTTAAQRRQVSPTK
ncbi:MAG: hypothetical protein OEY23_08165 [Acidimicrobiia bacterium]|nr:hypothetical protein [Acidimicrobiia bacterium]